MSKRKKNIDGETVAAASQKDDIVVVKKCLSNCCYNQQVLQKIRQDVTEMSNLIVEASRLIHFSLMKSWADGVFTQSKPRFLDNFYCLLKGARAKYDLDAEYKEIRQAAGLKLYDKSYRSNLFVDAAAQYDVIFCNNIWMLAYTRVRKYFRRRAPEIKSYTTLDYLFNKKSSELPNEDLLEMLRADLKWDGHKFYTIKSEPWKYISFFYYLSKFNETNNWKNFALIPIYKHGAHHIRYDSLAFHNLLNSLKLIPAGSKKWKLFNRDVEWRKYFKFPETATKKLNYSMTTDSFAVSFSMLKLKKQNNNDCQTLSSTSPEQQGQNNYSTKIGLDPGLRLILAGVRYSSDGQGGMLRETIILKNSYYHNECGFADRRRKLQKYTKTMTALTTEEQQSSPMSCIHFQEYTRIQLKCFTEKQRIFLHPKVTRLKFQKYICVEKAYHMIAKEILGNVPGPKLVCVGSTEIAANSPIRGYRRAPHKKIVDKFRIHGAHVVLVNEFRTTKLSANCLCENITSKSPHRYQFCPNCHTSWNRDVNAGVNILYLGECMLKINDMTKDEKFCRK